MNSARPTSLSEVVWNDVDLHRLNEFAREFVFTADCNLCIGLVGTLGAGKTRLVQEVARCLGVDVGEVTSPTFTLVQHYQGSRPSTPRRGSIGHNSAAHDSATPSPRSVAPASHEKRDVLQVHHVDAYRIQDEDEWFEAGMEELIHESLTSRAPSQDDPEFPREDLENRFAWVLIEWADRFEDLLPESTLWIQLTHQSTVSQTSSRGSNEAWNRDEEMPDLDSAMTQETSTMDSLRQISVRSACPAHAALLRHLHDHPAAKH